MFLPEQRAAGNSARVGASDGAKMAGPGAEARGRSGSQWTEEAMRLIDVVLASVLLGLVVGFIQLGQPGAAKANGVREAGVSERITWLWTPAIARRTSSIQ